LLGLRFSDLLLPVIIVALCPLSVGVTHTIDRIQKEEQWLQRRQKWVEWYKSQDREILKQFENNLKTARWSRSNFRSRIITTSS
jgi:hypothetical protein